MTHDTPFWLQPESRRLEFKEAWPGGDKIARTTAAFANGAGGRIVFGVRNEPRAVLGLSDSDLFRLEEQVINHIVDRCAPAIVPEVFIQNADGASLLVVEIYPGSRKPYHLKKSGPDVVWDDLDLQEFSVAYQRATDRPLDTAAYKKLGLAADARNGTVPTNAAILLAGAESIRRWFPYAKIECARFKGTTPDVFLDQATIRGPVFSTVEPTLAFIKRNIALGSTIGEVYRTDTWEYPLEALREAITNAVIHRDYWIAGSDIKVAIFDGMLEITSPGALPDSIAPEALGTGRSEIRNRVLAPIFKDLGLIESWGTGIQRIRREAKDHGNVRLVFQEVGNAFQVQFVKTNVTAQVTREVTTEVAMEVTTEVSADVRLASVLDGEMSRRQIMVRLGLRNEEHFRKVYLIPALESGLIERTIPDKPRSSKQKYRLTDKGRRSR